MLYGMGLAKSPGKPTISMIKHGVYEMKRFILSILCALPALLFVTGTHATIHTSTLAFDGLAVITDDSLFASINWDLSLDLPTSDGAWYDLNYEIGGKVTPFGGPVTCLGDCSETFYHSGSIFEDKMLSLEDINYALMGLAYFIEGGPYADDGFLLAFQNDEDLLGGHILLSLESGFDGVGLGGLGEGLGFDGELGQGTQIDFKGALQLVADDHEVPEPGTLALLGIGLLGFGIRRRLTR